jgi:hypothetical protein
LSPFKGNVKREEVKYMYWVTGIIGLALMAAPFVLGYANNTAALWASVIVGGMALIVSFVEGVVRGRDLWEYWTAVLLGIIAIVAPFIFNFSGHVTAMWTMVIAGVLLAIFAGTKVYAGQLKGQR